jgi:tetratricopeptide (TPR) repeat protein
MDPAPVDASRLYEVSVAAWSRYLDKGNKPSDLAETIQKATEALDAAGRDHPQRNDILLILIFALLEQNLDQSSLERIEQYFSELEGWKEMENDRKADARAIADKLATQYLESYNRAPSDADFDRCLSNYTRARKYSDKFEDRTNANLKIATLHQQRGQFEVAMGVIENAKSACPPDRPDLLSSISIAKFTLHQVICRSTGSSEELEKAIIEGEAALQIDSMAPTERARTLVNVAQCIFLLSENSPEVDLRGRMRDAIHYARQAVELGTGDEGSRVRVDIALADVLSSRRTQPTTRELDEAIGLYRKAKKVLEGDAALLASLANAICFRCEKGEVAENGTTIQSAIELYEEALTTSRDNRWNSRIANNIAYIYVEKANNTNDEVDYEKARENYLKAADYLGAAAAESDPGDANDIGYYRDQAEIVTERLKKGANSSGRKPTPKRQSTGRGSL